MLHAFCFLCAVTAATSILSVGCAGREASRPEYCLVSELLESAERDQEVRRLIVQHLRESEAAEIPPNLQRRMSQVDGENLTRLKRIVNQHGWPTVSLVGREAAQAAWLLVQHADSDPNFQARVLKLMKPLVANGEVSTSNFALLTDRVLVARRQPQLYGTQYKAVEINGVIHFGPSTPIADPSGLEQRRSALKLQPHAGYVRQLREMIGVPEDAPALSEE